MTVFSLIRSDYVKYRRYGSGFLATIFLTQGFWASFQYRIAHLVYVNIRNKRIRKIVMIPFYVWQKLIEIVTGISIPAAATIGHSFYIGHFSGIIINSNAILGSNCNISQGVTIAVSGIGERRGVPKIGNNVYIGAGAVVAGEISVGDNVVIGACSLVNRDLPENAVALGVPAQIVSNKGSEGYI